MAFFFKAILFEKEKCKFKILKLNFFCNFSIARIRKEFKKVIQVGNQNYRRMLKFFYFQILFIAKFG
jgi:hypothetical protein